MTDTENVFDGFALLGDDEEFDVDKIFGGSSDEPAPPPPAPTLAEEVKPQFDPEHGDGRITARAGIDTSRKDAGSTGKRKTASGTLFSVYKRRK